MKELRGWFATLAVAVAFAFARVRQDALESDETIAVVQANQTHALRVSALNRNVADRSSHERAARADARCAAGTASGAEWRGTAARHDAVNGG